MKRFRDVAKPVFTGVEAFKFDVDGEIAQEPIRFASLQMSRSYFAKSYLALR